MSVVVHVSTELSGGAGGFVRHLHMAMQGLGLPSLVLARERAGQLEDVVTIKPMGRIAGSVRARGLTMMGKLGWIDNSYAMFGMEHAPVGPEDIQHALGGRVPRAFFFYWLSYFVDFGTIEALRRAYPSVPFALLCMDEALLTGGCHYSHGCVGFERTCGDCPALALPFLQRKVERGFVARQAQVAAIDPVMVYPTTNLMLMGQRSAATKQARSLVVPLGAISHRELTMARERLRQASARRTGKATLLVRASTEHRKGCDLLAGALAALHARVPDLRARLRVISIGDDALTAAGIDRYVEHEARGYVSREGLMAAYLDVDAFIVTSREDGGPLMTNECVALGIFVISTPIGVARDLIVDGHNGLITRDIGSEAIEEALLRFMDHHAKGKLQAPDSASVDGSPSPLTFEGYIQQVLHLLESPGLSST